MIPKPLDQITEEDLRNLVITAAAERKTLDYKQQLPETNDAGKRELLADVSSFANTAGGDLVFGMTENAGIPTGIPGVQIGDTDQEILRFDSIIRTGLSPRIRHSTRAIALENGGYVLIIRAEHSWYGPHRVTFKEDSRFYGRTTNGKYPLDVTDLRNAFLFSNTITEKLSAFRSERIIALASGQTLAPLGKGPMLVIHCLPLESFSGKGQFDVLALKDIEPLGAARLAGYGSRVNFEGRICVAHASDDASAYTQVFRSGVIEAVRVGILNSSKEPSRIPSLAYEECVVTYLPHCFEISRRLGCSPPVLVGISLVGVRGLKMAVSHDDLMNKGDSGVIEKDVLLLPEIVVESPTAAWGSLLKPTLDLVWNACGYAESPWFDSTGKWVGRTR